MQKGNLVEAKESFREMTTSKGTIHFVSNTKMEANNRNNCPVFVVANIGNDTLSHRRSSPPGWGIPSNILFAWPLVIAIGLFVCCCSQLLMLYWCYCYSVATPVRSVCIILFSFNKRGTFTVLFIVCEKQSIWHGFSLMKYSSTVRFVYLLFNHLLLYFYHNLQFKLFRCSFYC